MLRPGFAQTVAVRFGKRYKVANLANTLPLLILAPGCGARCFA
jgi:hypothetical protein